MQPIAVFIVDDHPFFRSGVAAWLRQQGVMTCCGEAGTVAEARRQIPATQPDVVLLDLNLPDGDGLDLAAELSQSLPKLRVIILSQADEEAFAHRALRAGARGYIMKSEATETVWEAVQKVMSGGIFVSRPVSARLLQNLFPDPVASTPELARLSDRELQVFQLLGAGCKNAEIAAKLKISPKTVDTYRENLKLKLHLTGDALSGAARRWVELGEYPDSNLSPAARSDRTAAPS
jgi:DNA-binding NarL/FixJ family response regulator